MGRQNRSLWQESMLMAIAAEGRVGHPCRGRSAVV